MKTKLALKTIHIPINRFLTFAPKSESLESLNREEYACPNTLTERMEERSTGYNMQYEKNWTESAKY